MQKNIVWIVIGIIVLIGAIVLIGGQKTTVQNAENTEHRRAISDTTSTDTAPALSDQENPAEMAESVSASAGYYEEYDASKLARAENGDVILFFKASWCPTCRALEANIKANLDNIPEGVSILELDYDRETALKQKYGVVVQHTLVQVDSEGNLLKKWSGSPTLDRLVSEII